MSPTPLDTTGEPRMIAKRYELVEERGRGPRTALFAAIDHALSRRVLVRIFVADATDHDRLLEQEAEVRQLASFEHPALPRLFDAGIDVQADGRPVIFIVSDHNEGRDLLDAIAQAPLSAVEVAELGIGLADALAVLHAADRVHGCVVPSNVLVRPSSGGEPPQGTLIDIESGFVARVLSGVAVSGCPADVADPLAAGLREPASPRQDVYALGYCLAMALRGAAPEFHADGRLRVGIMTARPLGEVLRRMTAPDPVARPSASEVHALLSDYLLSEIPVTSPVRAQNGGRTSTEGYSDLLTSEPDELFTRITRLATSLTGTTISVLSFLHNEIATPRGVTGVEVPLGQPLHGALCAVTVQRSTPWAVANIWDDPRTSHIVPPLPREQVTSYAAAPLRSHDGVSVGSLCVFAAEQREFSEEELDRLVELAAIAMRDIEMSATGRRSRELFR